MNKTPSNIYSRIGIKPPEAAHAATAGKDLAAAQKELDKVRSMLATAQSELKKKQGELATAQLALTQLQDNSKNGRIKLEGELEASQQESARLKKELSAAVKDRERSIAITKQTSTEKDVTAQERDAALQGKDELEKSLAAERSKVTELTRNANDLIDGVTDVVAGLPPDQLTPELEQHLRKLIAQIATLEEAEQKS